MAAGARIAAVAAEADPVDEAWARLGEQWDEPEAHRKFLGLCATLERLPEAGRRYREVRDGDPDPDRRAMAERQIDRLLGLAMQSMEAYRSPPVTNRWRRILVLVAVVISFGMIGLTSWLVLR